MGRLAIWSFGQLLFGELLQYFLANTTVQSLPFTKSHGFQALLVGRLVKNFRATGLFSKFFMHFFGV